ncbi:MAG: hemerythrin domain-containing protein, partial [Prevotella sp.]|nr:hemerythrin domain-containing protein [Prevotella sp.]
MCVIGKLFSQSSKDLLAHLQKEENVLFPFIRAMVETKLNNAPIPSSHFETVENPITMMHHEHDTEGERFRKISELSNNYTPPAEACNTYKVTFSLINEFENDLHKHIHLE